MLPPGCTCKKAGLKASLGKGKKVCLSFLAYFVPKIQVLLGCSERHNTPLCQHWSLHVLDKAAHAHKLGFLATAVAVTCLKTRGRGSEVLSWCLLELCECSTARQQAQVSDNNVGISLTRCYETWQAQWALHYCGKKHSALTR